jgi:C-terminal processing protease CtpA/Prc
MFRRHPILILVAILLVAVAAAAYAAISSEKGKRAFLGVVLDEVTEGAAVDYGVKAGQGALVRKVTSDSPAEEAGLRANDIIVKFDGSPVESADSLKEMLGKKSSGDVVQLGIIRGGKEQSIEVTLRARQASKRIEVRTESDEEKGDWPLPRMPKAPKRAFAGVHLQELSEGLAKYFSVEKGVLISDVEEGSPAEKAGIEAGDVIIRVDGVATDNAGDVHRLVRCHEPGEKAKFEVVRKGEKRTIEVELEGRPDNLGRLDLHGFGLGPHMGRWKTFRDEERRELLDDLRGSIPKVDTDDIREKVYEFQIELQPELEELKARVQELEKEIERLKEERFQQQKM